MQKTANSPLYFIIIGIFFLSIPSITNRFVPVSDVFRGLFMGIGIGILLLALIYRRKKTIDQ
ncbi:hypothetical protein [Galbibacter sp. PAP.153]|uniref:hypothetical protein n=1 Tax=Galbibacter sp. PAP.153 TaxID=3104623 RepID=UPI0030096037